MPNFINPYNFIPFGGEKGKAEAEKTSEKLSGVITYTVLTRTPLFIPNTSNDKIFQDRIKRDIQDADKKNEDIEEHKSYDFFSYHNLAGDKMDGENLIDEPFKPVIPGSELRGMLRSNYEILTNSCMSVIEDVVLSKRTGQVFGAGLLKKTAQGYELYEAEDCLWRTKGENNPEDEENWKPEYYTRRCYRQEKLENGEEVTEGDRVYFRYVKRPLPESKKGCAKPLAQDVKRIKEGESTTEGYLILGEKGPDMNPGRNGISSQKHCAHIFTFTRGNKKIDTLSDLGILEKVIAEYQDEKKPDADPNRYKKYQKALEDFKDGKGEEYFPVYYSLLKDGSGEKLLFLSPASKTREIYQNTITKMLGEHKMCGNRENLCPACSLFGIIGGEGDESFAVASRLRFADLTLVTQTGSAKECYEKDIITLPELSSPKLTNMEFYMKKPADDAVFWTYDYYIDAKGGAHILEQPEINGRKFYWHNLNMTLSSVEPNKRNMTIRPLRRDVAFRGKLYFDKISEKELQRLIWLLNAGEDCKCIEKAEHGYKLGAAKPLGLGSIAVHVDEVMVRSLDKAEDKDEIQYTEKPYEYCMKQLKDAGTALFCDDETIGNFRKMTCFEAIPDGMMDKISYPISDGKADAEGFQWFAKENHRAYRKKNNAYMTNSSPNARTQEFFAWYMEPMNTELLETSHPLRSQDTMDRGGNGQASPSGGAGGRGRVNGYSARTNRTAWEVGKEYKGKVTGYKPNRNGMKMYAKVQLESGDSIIVHIKNVKWKISGCKWNTIDEVLEMGSRVTVVYRGKDNEGHPQWECTPSED